MNLVAAKSNRAARMDVSETTQVLFFFQAEDGIRDLTVTGVQTCALPISPAQNWQPKLAAHPSAPTPSDHHTRHLHSGVSNSSPGDSLSMNRTINVDSRGDSHVHQDSCLEGPVRPWRRRSCVHALRRQCCS